MGCIGLGPAVLQSTSRIHSQFTQRAGSMPQICVPAVLTSIFWKCTSPNHMESQGILGCSLSLGLNTPLMPRKVIELIRRHHKKISKGPARSHQLVQQGPSYPAPVSCGGQSCAPGKRRRNAMKATLFPWCMSSSYH